MDLLCFESPEAEHRAYADPNILDDDRVLANLLKSEEKFVPTSSYFECVQKDISEVMRKVVAEWMFEVCEEVKCQEEVFPLSMNYLDRFLSVCAIKKPQLQLLGTACLLLASKLREPRPMSAESLIYYTDKSITHADLWSWEQLVVSKLKWELSVVTPGDFIFHILRRLPIDPRVVDIVMISRHAKTFIALSAREYKFAMYTPSIIAAASIVAALDGLGWTGKHQVDLSVLIRKISCIINVEKDFVENCMRQIEYMVDEMTHVERQLEVPAAAGPAASNAPQLWPLGDQNSSQDKIMEHEKAGTPTDVRDVHF